jgi:hypothetical protein
MGAEGLEVNIPRYLLSMTVGGLFCIHAPKIWKVLSERGTGMFWVIERRSIAGNGFGLTLDVW